MDKRLTILFATIGAAGTIFGIVDPTDLLFPPEPEPVGMLDTSVEGFSHNNIPGKIAFSLQHNGTGSFFIHGITFKTKNFEIIPCSPEPFHSVPAGMFHPVAIMPTDSDHFTNVKMEVSPLFYDNGRILTFDYYVSEPRDITIESVNSWKFWMNYAVNYSEDGDVSESKTATYHAHTVKNQKECE